MKILKLKSTITEMEDSLEVFNSRFEQVKKDLASLKTD